MPYMGISAIASLLQVALALLVSVQANPVATEAQRSQAISFAFQAMDMANRTLAEINAASSTTVSAPIASTPVQSPAPQQILAAPTVPVRDFQMTEEAQLNVNGSWLRSVDMQNTGLNYTGGAVQGRILFRCGYVSSVPGQPQDKTCLPEDVDVAGKSIRNFPATGGSTLDVQISGKSAMDLQVLTDPNGGFSFDLPNLPHGTYKLTIRNGALPVFDTILSIP